MKKGMLIAGMVILATIAFWGIPSGLEWVAVSIQVIIGGTLVIKSREKSNTESISHPKDADKCSPDS
jgi:hypothetical protein